VASLCRDLAPAALVRAFVEQPNWPVQTRCSTREAGSTVATAALSQRRRLSILLGLNALMIVALLVVGFASHSLGVLAAGGDYAADSAAILLGIVAVTIRERVGPESKAPTIVALINSGALLDVTILVIVEAVRRLLQGTPEIHGLPVLVTSGIAAVVMVVGALVLGRQAGSEDLHMRSVLLDTVADAVTSAAVAVTGAVIFIVQGLYWLDSVMAILVGLIIGAGATRLLMEVVRALRTGSPLDLDDDD
jgi:cobalt-zinc-cadmium efflux system protein